MFSTKSKSISQSKPANTFSKLSKNTSKVVSKYSQSKLIFFCNFRISHSNDPISRSSKRTNQDDQQKWKRK